MRKKRTNLDYSRVEIAVAAKPVSERDFLAGEILRVFKLLSLSFRFAGCFSSVLVLIFKKQR